ncbi:enoyl-CoA hydratase/isomerase family protein, partial [Mycolicibacterium vaccae]|nr:enoyl-CoA hydratase/isomerase family protein [Mycolicibacterium vaccae]
MSDRSAPLVVREDTGAVALLLLNRPAQRNALRYESWTALSEQLTSVAADPGLRGVVLAGAGEFFVRG